MAVATARLRALARLRANARGIAIPRTVQTAEEPRSRCTDVNDEVCF